MRGDTSSLVISDEEWLSWKKCNPPGIDQAGHHMVGHVGKVRREISLPVGDRLRCGVGRGKQKSEKNERRKIQSNFVFHCAAS